MGNLRNEAGQGNPVLLDVGGQSADFQLQSAVGASALDEGQCAAARRASVAAEVDLGRPLARQRLAPVTAQQVRQAPELVLLDQEVRLGPSTLGCAGTPDEGW